MLLSWTTCRVRRTGWWSQQQQQEQQLLVMLLVLLLLTLDLVPVLGPVLVLVLTSAGLVLAISMQWVVQQLLGCLLQAEARALMTAVACLMARRTPSVAQLTLRPGRT
jgi:hypothetical protein